MEPLQKVAYIRKTPSKSEWCVYSEKGKHMGCYDSEAEAKKRLGQIEYFKHKKASLTYSEIGKQAELNVAKALEEVQGKTTEEINRDTAYTWGSRAVACFELAAKATNEKEKDDLVARAADFRHEALEHAALVEDGGKLVGEIQRLVKADIASSKEANTIPYNGNRPEDKHPDPSEKEEGHGGDRSGLWVTPRGNKMKATANQNLGTIKKGDLVVITGSRGDKVLFYAEQDPTLVGIANKTLFTPQYQRKADATGFLKCHGLLSKSPTFITKLASELGSQVDPSVLDRLEEIKTTVSNNKDRVMSQLPVSPTINANLRMADATQYFSMRGIVPAENDTIQYIKASMAAHTNLPEDNWSDEVVKLAISNRKTAATLDWSDKLLLMQQWHLAGTLSQVTWQELLKLLDSDDFNEIREGIEMLFHKASETVKKPEEKTAAPVPPAPTSPPPAGKKYMWDAPSSQYVLVDAALKEVTDTLKKK